MKPDIRQMKSDIRQIKPDIRQMKPYIRQMKPYIRKLKPDIRQLKPNIRQMKPNIRQMNRKSGIWNRISVCLLSFAVLLVRSYPISHLDSVGVTFTQEIEDNILVVKLSCESGEDKYSYGSKHYWFSKYKKYILW